MNFLASSPCVLPELPPPVAYKKSNFLTINLQSAPLLDTSSHSIEDRYPSPMTSSVSPPNSPQYSSGKYSPTPSVHNLDECKDDDDENASVVSLPSRTCSRSILRASFGRSRCAKLNVYISKQLTHDYRPCIAQEFPDDTAFYYYINMSIGMQLNDEQLYMFTVGTQVVIIVNIELNVQKTNEMLFGVIVTNDQHRIGRTHIYHQNQNQNQNDDEERAYGGRRSGRRNDRRGSGSGSGSGSGAKWQWKLLGLTTMHMLEQEYGILSNELPMPSRRMHSFLRQLEYQSSLNIPSSIIDDVEYWHKPHLKLVELKSEKTDKARRRFKSSKASSHAWYGRKCRNSWYSERSDELWLKKSRISWQKMCKEQWSQTPAMPIVINGDEGDKMHRIEWIKFVQLPSKEYIGIACRWMQELNKWRVTAVCFNRLDVENKHRLLTSTSYLNLDAFQPYLDRFNSTYTCVEVC